MFLLFKFIVLTSISSTKKVFWIFGLLTLLAIAAFPMVQVDVDPESMLAENEPVRIYHNKIKADMSLYDMLFIGVTNDEHPDGVFNPETLKNIKAISDYASTLDGVISHEIMSPSNVDAIESGGIGVVKFGRVMPRLPTNRDESIAVRDRSIGNPFLINTQVSKDGKAIALYIPLKSKDVSWNISNQLKTKIAQIQTTEKYHLAGLPLAEDQFGVEMFIQMGISAPAAMFLIGLILWFFFRQVHLTIGSLLIAMVSVVITMGAFIATGNTLHIMSSMIPIFIMPIAVLDSVHLISHFYDSYDGDRKKSLIHAIKELWTPMLFTTLTTSVGFASLWMAPIPPIQVFGLYTGLGIVLAWLLTMTLLPAYIMCLPEKALQDFGAKRAKSINNNWLTKSLSFFDTISNTHRYLVLTAAVIVLAISGYGISTLVINDNPTKWFEKDHSIRKADTLVNERFKGSYMVYLTLSQKDLQPASEVAKSIKGKLDRMGGHGQKLASYLMDYSFKVDSPVSLINEGRKWIVKQIKSLDGEQNASSISDDDLSFIMDESDGKEAEKETVDLLKLDTILSDALVAYQIGKDPTFIKWTDELLSHIQHTGLIGKGQGIGDLVKKINRELHDGDEKFNRVPDSVEGVMETFVSFQSSHDLSRMWHIVTTDYSSVTLAMQLTSGDNIDVAKAVDEVNSWMASHPAPRQMKSGWSGLSYINIIWQEKMVSGMIEALTGSALFVLVIMIILFRSFWWGILSIIPLGMAITFIYGLAGLMGKDYDMPIAIISSLALGLSIDFAIHFMVSVREHLKQAGGSATEAIHIVFKDPARGIARNAIVVALGFAPLFLAPLVPYQTVGWLMMSIMIASGLATLLVLPAILHIPPVQKVLFSYHAKKYIKEVQI